MKDKIFCYIADVSSLKEDDLSVLSLNLPSKITDKINAKRVLREKLLTAVSYKMLFKYCGVNCPEIEIKNNGKPYLKNENVYFSISHSKNLALLVLSSSEVGADIENTKKERDYLSLAERYFTENECLEIKESENIKESFIRFWTAKEAYIKYTGEGFRRGVGYFEVSFKNCESIYKGEKMPYLYNLKYKEDNFISVASEKDSEIIINKIDCEDLK